MKTSLRISLFFISIFVTSCTRSSDSSDQLFQNILTFQDNRAPADSLYPYLRNSKDFVKSWAVTALGKMQDTAAIDTLVTMLDTPPQSLSREILFSLGQIGYGSGSVTAQSKIENALLGHYDKSKNPNVRIKLIEALGKNGSQKSFELLQRALSDSSAALVTESAMACARMAIRNFRNEGVDSVLVKKFSHADADVRWACVYALMRIRNKKFMPTLIPMLHDVDLRVRMDAARSIGLVPISEKDTAFKNVVNELLQTASNDTVWEVRVNAITALGNFKFKLDDLKKIYFLIAFEGKRDKNLHVRISAIRAMARSYNADISDIGNFLKPFTEKFLKNAEWQEQAETAIALAQMFGDKIYPQRALLTAMEEMLKGPNGYLRGRAVEALGETKSVKALPYLEKALSDSFALVKNNAVDALSKIDAEASRQMIIRSLETSDLTLLAISAGSLAGDEKIKRDKKSTNALSLKIIESYRRIKPPIDVEAQTGIFDALGDFKSISSVDFLKSYLGDSDAVVAKAAARNLEKITGGKFTISVQKKNHPIDWAYFNKLKTKKPSAVIQTKKGTIEIDFFVDDAPLSAINFLKLAERKFFDGTVFHRVVPNFVIQGGDPLGTGWGGPGYSIRSEFDQRNYERGMVGMASAGRDTEGCQWFITHSPQPHLNGRYTIFAKVRRGLEVVDEIQVGDTINSITVVWH